MSRARDDIGKWGSGRCRQPAQRPAPRQQQQERAPPQQRGPWLQEQQPHEAHPQQRGPLTPWQRPTYAGWSWDGWRGTSGEERESQQPSGAASSQVNSKVVTAFHDLQLAFGQQSGTGGQGRWEERSSRDWDEWYYPDNPFWQLS